MKFTTPIVPQKQGKIKVWCPVCKSNVWVKANAAYAQCPKCNWDLITEFDPSNEWIT